MDNAAKADAEGKKAAVTAADGQQQEDNGGSIADFSIPVEDIMAALSLTAEQQGTAGRCCGVLAGGRGAGEAGGGGSDGVGGGDGGATPLQCEPRCCGRSHHDVTR